MKIFFFFHKQVEHFYQPIVLFPNLMMPLPWRRPPTTLKTEVRHSHRNTKIFFKAHIGGKHLNSIFPCGSLAKLYHSIWKPLKIAKVYSQPGSLQSQLQDIYLAIAINLGASQNINSPPWSLTKIAKYNPTPGSLLKFTNHLRASQNINSPPGSLPKY